MRVLYISSVGYWGGVERFLKEILDHHANTDFDCQTLFFNDGPFFEYCKNYPFKSSIIPFKLKISKLKSWFQFRRYLIQYLSENKIDIIHCSMPYSFLFVSFALLGKRQRPKVVLFQHGPIGGWQSVLANLFKRDLQIYNSTDTQRKVHATLFSQQRLYREYLFYPVINVKKFLTKNQFENDPIFISVSRITPWKGIENNIQIFYEYLKIDKRAKLNIVGKVNSKADDIYKEKLIKLISKLGINESVNFLDFVEDVTAEYCKSSVFLHCPVIDEPFGISCVEAMAATVLVVTKKQGGTAEFINEENAVLISKDFSLVAKEIHRVLNDEKLYQAKVNRALEWVKDNIDREVKVPLLVEEYYKL